MASKVFKLYNLNMSYLRYLVGFKILSDIFVTSVMSHWFHRNVLKATTLVGFSNVFYGAFNLTKLGSDLRKCRERLLDLLPDPSQSIDTINTAFIAFLSVMNGFFMDYKISGKKIRYAFLFKWTHSLLGQVPEAQQDTAFDLANMSVNVGLWLMKHASFVASKKVISMNDAKEIHTSLRKAAGIFEMVQKDLIPLMEAGKSGSDLDPRVLQAYRHQCVAEAQEVTLARSIQMHHNDSLISALANETSKMFENAEISLQTLDNSISTQWTLYLQIKKCIYLAYAYCYSGKDLLGKDHCGEAIRSLRESHTYYNKALSLCKSYSKAKGPAKPVKPDGHSFFTGINSTVSLLLEKCERENGFIYHQKIPDYPPDLEIKETYGLASPEVCNVPPPTPLWEAAFENQELLPTLKENTLRFSSWKREKELPPVKEVDYLEHSEHPTEDHGCAVQ